jgi:hypothetical protein
MSLASGLKDVIPMLDLLSIHNWRKVESGSALNALQKTGHAVAKAAGVTGALEINLRAVKISLCMGNIVWLLEAPRNGSLHTTVF